MLAFEKTFATAAVTWSIELGVELKSMSVEAFVLTGGKYVPIYPKSVTRQGTTGLSVTFSSAQAGKVRVTGSTGVVIDYTGHVAPVQRTIDYTYQPYDSNGVYYNQEAVTYNTNNLMHGTN